jgi:hypothetical protein
LITATFSGVFLTAAMGSVDACEVCVAIGNYDGFRFGVFWFYLLIVWTVAALVTDLLEGRGRAIWEPRSFPFSGSALLLVCVVLVVSFAGLHFLALLAFPFLLAPYCLPVRMLRKKRSREKAQYAPQWFRRASQVTALLLALSVIPSYLLFPLMHQGAMTRGLLGKTRSNMKKTGTLIERYHETFSRYPLAAIQQHRGRVYSALDPANLTTASPDIDLEYAEQLLRDPFSYKMRSVPRVANLAVFFPYSLTGRRQDGVEKDPTAYDRIQYCLTNSGYALWSRGPDTLFASRFPEIVRLRQSGSTTASAALVQITYDPTNGTVSAGELYFIGPEGFTGW